MVLEVDPRAEHVLDAGLVDQPLQHRGEGADVELPVDELDDQAAQREVHHRVDRREPFLGVVRDLADHQRAGLLGMRGARQLLEEHEADVEGHVEPPAVDTVAQVAAHHRVVGRIEVLAHRRVLEVQLGQVLGAPPRAGAAGKLGAEDEPVAVRAGRVGFGLAEDRRVAPHVVEHAVEHQLHAASVHVGGQRLDVVARAVLGRDLQVVERVVLVVGERQADRVQVQHVGAQPLHMVQPRAGARQVAAPELDLVAPQLVARDIAALGRRLVPAPKLFWLGVEVALGGQVGARCEAVDQHLVDHGAHAPVVLAGLEDTGEFAVEAIGVVHGRCGGEGQGTRL